MCQNSSVLIQPKQVPELLSKNEMSQLVNILDKLLQKDVQLQLSYVSSEKSLSLNH